MSRPKCHEHGVELICPSCRARAMGRATSPAKLRACRANAVKAHEAYMRQLSTAKRQKASGSR